MVELAGADDMEARSRMLLGGGLTDDGHGTALVLMIGLASEHPDVLAALKANVMSAPDEAQVAFCTGIRCAEVGSAKGFQGGTLKGQAIFMAVVARAVAMSDEAVAMLAAIRAM